MEARARSRREVEEVKEEEEEEEEKKRRGRRRQSRKTEAACVAGACRNHLSTGYQICTDPSKVMPGSMYEPPARFSLCFIGIVSL